MKASKLKPLTWDNKQISKKELKKLKGGNDGPVQVGFIVYLDFQS